MKISYIVTAVWCLVFSSSLLADCRTKLKAIDQRLESHSGVPAPMLQGLRLMRDQGAGFCESGNETGAKNAFNSVAVMLDLLESTSKVQQKPIPAPSEVDNKPAESIPTIEEMVRTAKPQSNLTPFVVVTTAPAVVNLDWNKLRNLTSTDYANRWDDLSMIDSCLWISADELAKRLGLSVQLTTTNNDFQCKYRVKLPNGNGGVFMSLYVEFYQQSKDTRDAELRLSEGPGSKQFSPFNPGADDLKVYVNQRSEYLYVFPENGQTLWRIGYKAPYGLSANYKPKSDGGIEQSIGSVFVRMIVEKFASQL